MCDPSSPGIPSSPDEEGFVASLGESGVRVSREWLGVLHASGRLQPRGWNACWIAACLVVTVVLAVTHAHPVAFIVPIMALLVAVLTATGRPPGGRPPPDDGRPVLPRPTVPAKAGHNSG